MGWPRVAARGFPFVQNRRTNPLVHRWLSGGSVPLPSTERDIQRTGRAPMTTPIRRPNSEPVGESATEHLEGPPRSFPRSSNSPYEWPDEALERLWLALRQPEGDQRDAEVLRQAAALMRERAERAEASGCGEPWYPATEIHGLIGAGSRNTADAEHIASWHPAVALAVADWLEEVAWRSERVPKQYRAAKHALAVARAYLGSDA